MNSELSIKTIILKDLDSIKFVDIEEYMEYLKYYTNDKEITNMFKINNFLI